MPFFQSSKSFFPLLRCMGPAFALASTLFFASAAANAAVFLVNSTEDTADNLARDGTCSTGNLIIISTVPLEFAIECTFRAALEEANSNAGQDTVEFSGLLPTVAGIVELIPDTAYPAITDELIIDGYSHPSYDDADPGATPIINLRGSSTPAGTTGLRFAFGSDDSIARGLAISGFPGSGIRIADVLFTGPRNIRIQGNQIGIWRGGFYSGNGAHGIEIARSHSNIVGHSCNLIFGCNGKRNVISANTLSGIHIASGSQNNRINGNYIGVDSSGTSTFVPFGGSTSNGENGILIDETSTENLIGTVGELLSVDGGSLSIPAGNLISGNGFSGINVQGPDNTIVANLIGTNAAGNAALGNQGSGIFAGGDDTTIGGEGLRGNLISGNGSSGISVDTETGGDPFRLSILNNRIGVNADASAPLGNGNHGMLLWGGNHEINDNIIGGNAVHGISDTSNGSVMLRNYIGTNENGDDLGNGSAGLRMSEGNQVIGGANAGNVIGFNADGIVGGSSSYNNQIYGNYIGTNPAGDDLGNHGNGIEIDAPIYIVGSIDGRSSGLANTIGFNDGHGIADAGSETLIQGNYIGTNAAGENLGNGAAGIFAETIPGPDAAIGATLATPSDDVNRAGNIVAYNTEGILLGSTDSIPVRGNQLIGNGGPGVDLGGDGATPNDPLDLDAGANQLQNHPVFNTTTTYFDAVTGELNVHFAVDSSLASAAYPLTIDFYIHDPWLHEGDQARAHVGAVSYEASDAGDFVTATITPTPGSFEPNVFGDTFGGLRATATDAFGNTSELTRENIPVPEPGSTAMLAAGLLGLSRLAARRKQQSDGSEHR